MRRFIYPAPAWDVPELTDVEELTSTSEATYLLHRPGPPGAPTLVYHHGNGADLSSIGPLGDLVVDRGLGFAAVEYPGYGPARAQRATEAAIFEAARAGLRRLGAKGVDPASVVLVGESLGAAVAARMAHDGHGARLVLVSPFTSMTAMYRQITRAPLWPRALVPDRYDTDRIAPQIPVPTLLIHGEQDRLVPPRMSAELAELIPDARRVLVPGRDHNTLWEPPSDTLTEVLAFARAA